MSHIFNRIEKSLSDALEAANMKNASFGFPNDRIEVKSVHMGDVPCTEIKQGAILHPDAYIKDITRLYRQSWIVHPIEEALELIRAHKELIGLCEKLAGNLNQNDLEKIIMLSKAGRA